MFQIKYFWMKRFNHKLLTFSLALTCGLSILLLLTYIINLPHMNFMSKVGLVVVVGWILAILSFRKFFGEERTDALVKNLVILGVTLVVLLMLGEFIVRFVFRNITTTGDNTSYFAKRWKVDDVRLNRWGFREREFELSKPDDVYRIAVIGDSFTYGQGIEEENRFTNLLEKHLGKKRDCEVLNFGRPGAETIDHIEFLKDVVLKANPDFIILQWFVNDCEGHYKKDRPKKQPLIASKKLHRKLHESSALYYLLERQWDSLQQALGHSSVSYHEYMYQRFGDPESADSIEYKSTLKHFTKLCKNREIPLGIILFPELGSNLGKGYPLDYLLDRVIEICTNEKVTCIDLRSTFAKFPNNKKLWVNRFDGHPGSIANHLAMERLVSIFGHIWLSGAAEKTKGIVQLTNSNI